MASCVLLILDYRQNFLLKKLLTVWKLFDLRCSLSEMGCGSSQPVAPQQNAIRNGDVKRESPPPRQNEQPQIEEIRQPRPKEKRKDSAKSKSSSSSSSSRSSSAKSIKSRPETAPGGNAPPASNEQPVKEEERTAAVESTNSANSQESAAAEETPANTTAEEVAKVEESGDETTTQGAAVVVASDAVDNGGGQTDEHEKPNFSEDVLKEFVEVENQVKSLEEKGAENNYPIKHARLIELHKKMAASQENVEKLKAQT